MGHSVSFGNEVQYQAQSRPDYYRASYELVTNLGWIEVEIASYTSIKVTASHNEHTEYRICKSPDEVKQRCYDVLQTIGVTRIREYRLYAMENMDIHGKWWVVAKRATKLNQIGLSKKQTSLQGSVFTIQDIIGRLKRCQ